MPPFISNVGPKPPSLGLAGSRGENRDWRVIPMQNARSNDIASQRLNERRQGRRRRPDIMTAER